MPDYEIINLNHKVVIVLDESKIQQILDSNNVNVDGLAKALSEILNEYSSDSSSISKIMSAIDTQEKRNGRLRGSR